MRAAAAAALLAAALGAGAHDGLHEQIARVTARLDRDPAAASLYVERAELYRAHGDWDPALADLGRAARLAPGDDTLDFLRGRTLQQAGRFDAARTALDAYLARHPDHAEARVARARTWRGLGEPGPAAADYTRAIERLPRPEPDLYVERARVELALGEPERALAGLDAGLARIGPVPALQELALEIDLAQRRYDAALARLDRMLAAAARKETLLARRGDVLAQAGRGAEAREAWSAALAALAALPAGTRRTAAMQALEARLRAALAVPPALPAAPPPPLPGSSGGRAAGDDPGAGAGPQAAPGRPG